MPKLKVGKKIKKFKYTPEGLEAYFAALEKEKKKKKSRKAWTKNNVRIMLNGFLKILWFRKRSAPYDKNFWTGGKTHPPRPGYERKGNLVART